MAATSAKKFNMWRLAGVTIFVSNAVEHGLGRDPDNEVRNLHSGTRRLHSGQRSGLSGPRDLHRGK